MEHGSFKNVIYRRKIIGFIAREKHEKLKNCYVGYTFLKNKQIYSEYFKSEQEARDFIKGESQSFYR